MVYLIVVSLLFRTSLLPTDVFFWPICRLELGLSHIPPPFTLVEAKFEIKSRGRNDQNGGYLVDFYKDNSPSVSGVCVYASYASYMSKGMAKHLL